MSRGHARPKLTHMPHHIAAREEEAAERLRLLQADRAREYPCEVCGKVGPFGFNGFRHAPELAVHACHEHRDEVRASLA